MGAGGPGRKPQSPPPTPARMTSSVEAQVPHRSSAQGDFADGSNTKKAA